MRKSIESRDYTIQAQVRQLLSFLPYPITWYEKLTDSRISAIHRSHVVKMAMAAIEADDLAVRRKAGLC